MAGTVVIVRQCVACKQTSDHTLEKSAWGDKIYEEAMRIYNEAFTCAACQQANPTYQDYAYDWD